MESTAMERIFSTCLSVCINTPKLRRRYEGTTTRSKANGSSSRDVFQHGAIDP